MDKCFADNGFKCGILKEKKCEGCVFRKTYQQVEISKKRALRRLKSLDWDSRKYIAEKYGVGGII